MDWINNFNDIWFQQGEATSDVASINLLHKTFFKTDYFLLFMIVHAHLT